MISDRGDVTTALHRWRSGDSGALEDITECLYWDLRRIAAHYLRREYAPHTSAPASLVQEVYLRIHAVQNRDWNSRLHFLSVAASLMRHILVDHARRRLTNRRAGETISLHKDIPSGRDTFDVVAIHLALEKLGCRYPRAARVVELRFFGGIEAADTAEALGLSLSTVEREWRFAKAWLRNEITGTR